MYGEKPVRRGLVGALAFAAAMTLGPAAATAVPKGFPYKITSAKLDVIEVAKYSSTSSPSSWEGAGDVHHSLELENELPPLPTSLIVGNTNGVVVNTTRFDDGIETLINAEGEKDICSGTWEVEEDDVFIVRVKGKGDNLSSLWEIPTSISSVNCGVVYDVLDGPLKVKGKASGHIGSEKIVLETKGLKQDSEPTTTSTLTQEVKWEAKVVLKRVKPQTTPPGVP